ncbi:serine hydrolase-domain-containing protein [Talaromyces proteolyticus]|uniref:Serine hydrolase-domain-containing protein n=1 Tax=Talaromyces proteolyticus TaxID=1131652 RepID=A0AAD4KXH0_9EURO|nr:serine hydrolase-domain-containing protein [Talaromyces proteolyticus]KAH8703345.1 serine hydrolase-domain-containing protein [Talaromyces proteolyticus]
MKILCLHGRGSNNEIFQLQTAAFRAELEDFEFEYVQGTVPHTEGNWSLYTTEFPNTPLYGYYDPLRPSSIQQAEDDLLRLIRENGPFDGVLSYSGGTALAAQIIIRDALENPFRLPGDRPFRFATFINGVTPLKVFPINDAEFTEMTMQNSTLIREASALLLRDSATRVRKSKSHFDDHDPAAIKAELMALETKTLTDGRLCLSDGRYGITRYDSDIDGILIDIPTLHVRCPEEQDFHHGQHMTQLCDPEQSMQFHHHNGEDFPRGHAEMKKIAQMIRELAEKA